MLITNEKCTDEWKTEKTKSKNNTNITSPSSVSPKSFAGKFAKSI